MYLIYCPFPNSLKAEETASELITQKLAACVQILPSITSFYMWGENNSEEKIYKESEFPLLIKTSDHMRGDCVAFLEKNHPYSCPAIIQMKATANALFEAWVSRHDSITPPKE